MEDHRQFESDVDSRAKKFWGLGWPFLFVCAMTLLSEFGPRLGYSKPSLGAATPNASAVTMSSRQTSGNPIR